MKTDSKIQQDVLDELTWEPSVIHERIGVSVDNGVVTLSGSVPTYAMRKAAEEAAFRVKGVRAVAEELVVHLPGAWARNDTDIAKAVANALAWNTLVPKDKVDVKVEHGYVTLAGTVTWQFQKNAAEDCVRPLTGVKGVTNLIRLVPQAKASSIKADIEKAFERAAQHDADRVHISVDGGMVTLTGTVSSYEERLAAARTAWSAPGVTEVVNELVTQPYAYA